MEGGGGRISTEADNSDCLYRFAVKNGGKMELGNQERCRCLSTYGGSYTEMFGLVLKTGRKLPSKYMDSLCSSTLALWPDL